MTVFVLDLSADHFLALRLSPEQYLIIFMKNSSFVQDAAKIMIEKGWFEKAPQAVDREKIISD